MNNVVDDRTETLVENLSVEEKEEYSSDNNSDDDNRDSRLLEKYSCFTANELNVLKSMFQNYCHFKESSSSLSFLQKLLITVNANDDDDKAFFLKQMSHVEDLLPCGFVSAFEEVAVHSTFVFSPDPGCEDLEVFLEGMAVLSGRRGIDSQRRSFYDICDKLDLDGHVTAKSLVDLSYRLVNSSNLLLVLSNIKRATKNKPIDFFDVSSDICSSTALDSMVRSLIKEAVLMNTTEGQPPQLSSSTGPLDINSPVHKDRKIPKSIFLIWSDRVAFMIASSFGCFIDALLSLAMRFNIDIDSNYKDDGFQPVRSNSRLFGLMQITNSSIFNTQALFALSCMSAMFCHCAQVRKITIKIFRPDNRWNILC